MLFKDSKEIKSARTGREGPCPVIPLGNTTAIFNRCVPTALGSTANEVLEFINTIPIIHKVRDSFVCLFMYALIFKFDVRQIACIAVPEIPFMHT